MESLNPGQIYYVLFSFLKENLLNALPSFIIFNNQ